MELWYIKYAPKSIDEFLGNKKQLMKVIEWLKHPKQGKALLLYGPPGTGKTLSVYLAARILHMQVIETNASDIRDVEKIREMASGIGKQRTLFLPNHVILFDEVDGIGGLEERGAIQEIARFIKQSKYPVVLTANDAYTNKLRPLLPYCELVKYNKVPAREIYLRLKYIAMREGLEIDDKALKFIAEKANGDVRGAINDLQILAQSKKKITYEEALEILGYREYDKEIFEVLPVIFKTTSFKNAMFVASQLNVDFDMLFEWIRENISIEYKDADDVALAYYYLARGDLFRKRIMKRQYWRFLVYAQALAVGGVAVAKKKKYPGFTRYQYPLKIKLMKERKEERTAIKEEMQELAKKLHTSTKKIKDHYLYLLELLKQKH
ncbi:MAG: replication factor C large subunit [Candidatus Nanohaloarchaeota archaeon]|nr:replication factor C large subunit [Candidatus Nanohaloarchaeota archaeon]